MVSEALSCWCMRPFHPSQMLRLELRATQAFQRLSHTMPVTLLRQPLEARQRHPLAPVTQARIVSNAAPCRGKLSRANSANNAS